jgi:hypothetical protein
VAEGVEPGASCCHRHHSRPEARKKRAKSMLKLLWYSCCSPVNGRNQDNLCGVWIARYDRMSSRRGIRFKAAAIRLIRRRVSLNRLMSRLVTLFGVLV